MDYKFRYDGDLRIKAIHGGSAEIIETDAPIDNQGQGRYFSPTDLTTASLLTCMMTIAGITAKTQQLEIQSMEATALKTMASSPRRIARIEGEIRIACDATERQRKAIEDAARNCPVALSLHPELRQEVRFLFVAT
jgi:uncharacterized OsmC-like protein